MRILITGAASALGQAIAVGLRTRHQLRLTDSVSLDTDLEFVASDLGQDERTDALVKDIDAIVHLAYTPREGDAENAWLDANSRRHYNLLLAASEAGVQCVLLLSTLDLFQSYDVDMAVSENWQPQPNTDPTQLGAHIAEFTAREFAHSNALDIVILRLGHIVHADRVAGQPFDPMWLDERDAARAVECILQKHQITDKRPMRHYHVLHLQSVSERARFSSDRICGSLEFTPQHSFEANV